MHGFDRGGISQFFVASKLAPRPTRQRPTPEQLSYGYSHGYTRYLLIGRMRRLRLTPMADPAASNNGCHDVFDTTADMDQARSDSCHEN